MIFNTIRLNVFNGSVAQEDLLVWYFDSIEAIFEFDPCTNWGQLDILRRGIISNVFFFFLLLLLFRRVIILKDFI